jgi:AcrR family transcriptional regulator
MPAQDRMIFQTDETRSAILDAAWKIFLEKGFFDAQMKDVAEATGISRTSLYRYFQDKTDLAMALVGRTAASRRDGVLWLEARDDEGKPLPVLEALAGLLKERWLSPELREDYVFLAEFDAYFSGSRVTPDFKEEIAEALDLCRDDALLRLIERGIADGSLRPALDPHLTMVTLVNALRAMQQRLLLRGNSLAEVAPGELERMPQALLDLLIEGLRNT